MLNNEKLNKFIEEECTDSEKAVFDKLTLDDVIMPHQSLLIIIKHINFLTSIVQIF